MKYDPINNAYPDVIFPPREKRRCECITRKMTPEDRAHAEELIAKAKERARYEHDELKQYNLRLDVLKPEKPEFARLRIEQRREREKDFRWTADMDAQLWALRAQGYTCAMIADVMGNVTPKAVENRLYNMRKNAKRSVENEPEPTDPAYGCRSTGQGSGGADPGQVSEV